MTLLEAKAKAIGENNPTADRVRTGSDSDWVLRMDMKDQLLRERITLNPGVMMGKPVIKGTRLTVAFILNLLARGSTTAEIVEEYKG
jgi:hypothetical protein